MCLNKVCTVALDLALFQILSEFLDLYLKDLRIRKQDTWQNNLMSRFLLIDTKSFMTWLRLKGKLLSSKSIQSEIFKELAIMLLKLSFSMGGKLSSQS